MLPNKDTVEELFFKEKGMTRVQNLFVTLALVVVSCTLALFIPDIGSAMTLVGSTINPVIGFLIPVSYKWKVNSFKENSSLEKVKGVLCVLVIAVTCTLSLINFFTSDES